MFDKSKYWISEKKKAILKSILPFNEYEKIEVHNININKIFLSLTCMYKLNFVNNKLLLVDYYTVRQK